MKDNVSQFPSDDGKPVKKFLKKPMAETTIGDTLILHAGTVLISIFVSMSIQALVLSVHRNTKIPIQQ